MLIGNTVALFVAISRSIEYFMALSFIIYERIKSIGYQVLLSSGMLIVLKRLLIIYNKRLVPPSIYPINKYGIINYSSIVRLCTLQKEVRDSVNLSYAEIPLRLKKDNCFGTQLES